MAPERSVALSDREADSFLGRGGVGVLALAEGNVAYAVPVSYGYEPDAGRLYLRLGFVPGSEKRAFVETTETARLVVYEPVDSGWTSVVATGRLEPVTPEAVDETLVHGLRGARLPQFDMFDAPLDDVELRPYEFVVETLTGRTTANADASDEVAGDDTSA